MVFDFNLDLMGTSRLETALLKKSQTDFEQVGRKNIRDIYSRSQKPGGTPVDTNELRKSAAYRGDTFYYLKHYGPHVEYGHRKRGGGYTPGQFFLKNNVDEQRPIYKEDLREKLRE